MSMEYAVSVIMISYNHEKYIAQAIESVLEQKTDFIFEILLGDDASTDGTQNIIRKYATQYKDRFRLILRQKNIGATNNIKDLMARAKGKYLAFLETDDYWCDCHKLQKQFDFLESNLQYSGCGHQCHVVDEKGRLLQEMNRNNDRNYWYFSKNIYDIHDFNMAKAPGQLASLFCRNYWIQQKKELNIISYAHYLISDKTILMLLLCRGNIYFMNEVMHCYRLVEKKGQNNYKSLARTQNLRYEEYLYFCIIEAYAKERKHIDIDLSLVKKDKLICASVFFLKNMSWSNLLVVIQMIFERGRVIHNTLICVRAIILKCYYMYILKEDRPICI